MNALFHIVRVLFGVVFIASAWLKLDPIEPFEFTFVEAGIGGWKLAPFFARLVIGAEFAIGAFFLFYVRIPRYLFLITLAMLVFFIGYLLLLIFWYGNSGNCGCFGDSVQMTPLQAIIKNVLLIAFLWVMYKYQSGNISNRVFRYFLALVAATSFSMPFILNPVDLSHAQLYLDKEAVNVKLDMDLLYDNATLRKPPRTLSKGKHVLAFLSLTCKHCRMAANKLRLIHERQPSVSLYFILNGKWEKLPKFYELTHSEKIPHCMLWGKPFVMLAGVSLPTIYLVNNGVVEHVIDDYIAMTETDLVTWFSK